MDTSEQQQTGSGEVTGRHGEPTDDARMSEIRPTVERGRNVTAIMPPAPWYLAPALAGLAHRARSGTLQLLVLASDAMLESVGRTVAREWHAAGGTSQVARTAGTAGDLLRQNRVGALVTTPLVARTLLGRSSLPLVQGPAVLLAWPETWDDETPLVDLMQDLPSDSQRLIYSADSEVAARLTERHAQKALVLGPSPTADPRRGVTDLPVTVVTAQSHRRDAAILELLDTLDPAEGFIWTCAEESREALTRILEGAPRALPVVPEVTGNTGLIVAADLPTPEAMRRLSARAGRLVLVTPPWGLPYVALHAGPVTSLRLRGASDAAGDTISRHRAAIEESIGQSGAEGDRALYALAPLFERHDPARVAAALYRLWAGAESEPGAGVKRASREGPEPTRGRDQRREQPGAGGPRSAPGTARVFVTVGRKDGATAADFVGLMAKELRVPREDIGRIDLRETFSLIELPAGDAERIAQSLNGRTIRRRKVTARLERQRS